MKPVIAFLATFLALGAITPALAQRAYPERPVRFVVGFPPGSAADVIARIVAPKLGDGLGQPVIVENRPGAASNIGAAAAYRAEPDGTTLLSCPTPTLSISLYKDLPYDPAKFVPITVYATLPNAIAGRVDIIRG